MLVSFMLPTAKLRSPASHRFVKKFKFFLSNYHLFQSFCTFTFLQPNKQRFLKRMYKLLLFMFSNIETREVAYFCNNYTHPQFLDNV